MVRTTIICNNGASSGSDRYDRFMDKSRSKLCQCVNNILTCFQWNMFQCVSSVFHKKLILVQRPALFFFCLKIQTISKHVDFYLIQATIFLLLCWFFLIFFWEISFLGFSNYRPKRLDKTVLHYQNKTSHCICWLPCVCFIL